MIVPKLLDALDARLGSAEWTRRAMKKVFPDHWSFMLGEISVYCFMALVVTGTYVAFFYEGSDRHVIYRGPYASLIGRSVPASYASVLNLSFAVPAGLLIRQMHHWAALLFVAAIMVHMARVFFTGAFRKPRELNWVVGLSLLAMGMAAGFTGYSLPGDLLSGAGLRIAYSVAQSIPVIGTRAAYVAFGGPFPTDVMTGRLYFVHVFVLPLVIFGLIGTHLSVLWRQHHTQFRGSRRTETNVVGSAVYPYYAMKSIGLLAATFAVLALLGGFFTINPIWIYGPFDPWTVSSPSAPDWYVAWLDGLVRLGPPWEVVAFGHAIPPLFWSAVVPPGVLFAGMFAWPWIEKRFTPGDVREHNLLDMPYDKPWRLGLGVAVVTLGTVLGFASSDDVQAKFLHIHVETLMPMYRGLAIVLPVAFGLVAVSIGRELEARFRTPEGKRMVRRAMLVRNAEGGFDDERRTTPA